MSFYSREHDPKTPCQRVLYPGRTCGTTPTVRYTYKGQGAETLCEMCADERLGTEWIALLERRAAREAAAIV